MRRIKRNVFLFLALSLIVLSYFAYSLLNTAPVKVISLVSGDFEHIQFGGRQPVVYSYHENVLIIEVDNNASFLMRAFDAIELVNKVSFEWKSTGLPAIIDVAHEMRRDGDDAVFKLGLLIESQEAVDDVFLPSWMRRVNELLNFHSGEMYFLVAGAKHAAQQQWPGPYNKRMTMISVASEPDDDQVWNKASYEFSEPVKVVALWLMADGDDTSSSFTTYVKNIEIE
jgi:hypothetical protein